MATTTWMKDGIGQRPGRSTYVVQVSFGLQRSRRCTDCGKRYWRAAGYPGRCECGGDLGPEHDDKLVKQRSGIQTRKSAEKIRNEWRSMRDAGELPFEAPDASISVAEYLRRYLDGTIPWGDAPPRPDVQVGYRRKMDAYVVTVIGGVALTDLRPKHIRSVKEAMLAKGLAPRTIRQTMTILHRALRRAVEEELIPVNPATAVAAPKAARPDTGRLNYSDIERIVSAAEGSKWAVAIALAGATGMRRSELLALTWDHVDYTDGGAWLTVSGGLHRLEDGSYVVLPPKSDAGSRTVPVGRPTAELLREHRKAQLERRLLCGAAWSDGPAYIVDDGIGGPADPDAFSRYYKKTTSALGLSTRLHDVRHAVATELARQGFGAEDIARFLGHHSAAFTYGVYIHGRQDGMAALAAGLAGAADDGGAVQL